jgi:WD40 repeat protein
LGRLATAGRDHRVKVWQVGEPELVVEIRNPTFRQVAFTPDGCGIVADGCEAVVIRDAASGAERVTVKPAGHSWVFSFAPDGRLAIYSNVEFLSNNLQWYSPTDGSEVAAWDDLSPSGGCVFRHSPDGRHLALPSYQQLTVWDLNRRELITSADLPAGSVPLLDYSPDARVLVYGAGRRLIVLETQQHAVVAELRNPRSHFTGVAFHPSGRYLAATSNDETVKLYDTATWQVARTLTWKAGRMRSVAFSPDGSLAAAGTENGKVVVWDVDV